MNETPNDPTHPDDTDLVPLDDNAFEEEVQDTSLFDEPETEPTEEELAEVPEAFNLQPVVDEESDL